MRDYSVETIRSTAVNGIPRRCRLDLSTPAELAIRAAVDVVEIAGCHPLLTDAVILLQEAREKVADYVDAPGSGGGHSEPLMALERFTFFRQLACPSE